MSFLLTPVALICPILSGNIPSHTNACATPAIAQQEQAICRIHQHEKGVTDVSIGMHSIAIYPIHYVDAEQQHIIFATKLLSQQAPKSIKVWTGDINTERVSSNAEIISLNGEELQLISVNLKDSFNAASDHLCLSFESESGRYSAAQIQLRNHAQIAS